MTVSEIKETIVQAIKKVVNTMPSDKETILIYERTLDKVLDMLNELEPNTSKWVNNMNGTFTCSKCGAKRPNDNYCGNCGARMNDELKENNK